MIVPSRWHERIARRSGDNTLAFYDRIKELTDGSIRRERAIATLRKVAK